MWLLVQIWNHPDVLYKILTQKNAEDNDLDIETTENGQVKKKAKRGRKSAAATSGGDNPASPFGDRKSEVSINYDWVCQWDSPVYCVFNISLTFLIILQKSFTS